MNLFNKIPRYSQRMSITTKSGLIAGLSISLIIIVAATGFFSLNLFRNAEKSIQVSSEIQRLIIEMDRGMENSRRLHANFFLQYPAIGLSKAHENYAQPSIRRIAHVITTSNNLKHLINSSTVSGALHESRVDLNLYLSSAKRFAETSIQSIELVTKLATPKRGLEAQLESQLTALRTEIEGVDTLLKLFHQITHYTQSYMIKRQRFLMQSAFNEAFKLEKAIANLPDIKSVKKENASSLLKQYINTAEQILDVDVKIKAIFNDFSLQTSITEPISTALTDLASKEIKLIREKNNQTYKVALYIIISFTILGLLTAVTLASILNRSITQKVVKLTRATREFRKGNLNVSVNEDSLDELGQLARTFNIMSSRIRELVNTLEDKVTQRTHELESSNIKLLNEIQERIKAEANLKDTQALLQAAMDNSQAGIAIAEAPNGRINYINKAGLLIHGKTEDFIMGNITIETYPTSLQLFDLNETPLKTGEDPLAYAIIHEKSCSKEYVIRRSDNKNRIVWANAAPIFNKNKEVKAAIVIFLDITDRKHAEKEKENLELQLRQAHKMEAIGTLAGGIAHDFNNILAAIIGYAEIAKDDIPDTNPARNQIDEVLIAGKRAKELVKQILSFSRKSQQTRKPIQIQSIIKDVISLLRASISSTIEIRQDIHTNGGRVLADTTQIHQVLMNICTNAAQAMDENGGVLKLTLDSLELTEKDIIDEPDIKPGPFVKLSVKDTGIGIDKKNVSKIFDPYFTTKDIGKGSGMGLSVVHGIVKSYGGIISVESTPNKGTTFIVYLPMVEQAIQPIKATTTPLPGGVEHILIVDDEIAITKLTSMRLERLGYRTTSITSSIKALELFRSSSEMFDLVITDQSMPQMTGEQMAIEMLKIRANIPIVLCTGYSSKIDDAQSKEIGIRAFAHKPISKNELAKTIREVLDKCK